MSVEQAVGLWIEQKLGAAVGGVPASGDLPFDAERALATMPEERRAEVARVLGRIVLGPESALAGAPVGRAVFRACVDAFVRGRPLALLYRDAKGNETERRVEIHGLSLQPPVWYLLCRDMRKNEPRTFRLDRVVEATPMLGRFEPVSPMELFENLEGRTFQL